MYMSSGKFLSRGCIFYVRGAIYIIESSPWGEDLISHRQWYGEKNTDKSIGVFF